VYNDASTPRIIRRLTTLFFILADKKVRRGTRCDRTKQEGADTCPCVVIPVGFAAGKSRTQPGFRRNYNATADETLSPNRFR
jgi:hypothetical protein